MLLDLLFKSPALPAPPHLVGVALAVVSLPLLAFLLLAVFGKKLPNSFSWLAIGATFLSACGGLYLFSAVFQGQAAQVQVSWLSIPGAAGLGGGEIKAGLLLDNLSVTMLVLASFISLLVQVYSQAYLKGDPNLNRYYAFLSLFTGSMLAMVLADNLLVLFILWELVGFSSYLLIGFWREREEAGLASLKAFLVNRVSDVLLLAGLLLVWAHFGTFDLLALREILGAEELPFSLNTLTVIGLLLFAGCVGKSAQFPLQVWLPDAMAGPTPVSALLHAATMVAAGVFLLARCFMFYTPDALMVMAIIGSITMVLGAVAALGQYDIKRVLAYSTVSQLGYMVLGMGTGGYDAALLHLCTHAFFKAALFLLAGIIIHYVHHHSAHHNPAFDAQDMRNMGGLRKKMPVTFALYLVAAAALVGLPLFSGFLSKDALILNAWNWADYQAAKGNWAAYLVPDAALLTVLLTAWYIGRQIWMVFIKRPAFIALTGEPKEEAHSAHKPKEAPLLMLIPVLVLSLFCLGMAFSLNPFHATHSWLREGLAVWDLAEAGFTPAYQSEMLLALRSGSEKWMVPVFTLGLALVGLLLAWRIGHHEQSKRTELESAAVTWPARAAGMLAPLVFHTVLMDKLYWAALVKPLLRTSVALAKLDARIIDRAVDATGKSFVVLAKLLNWADRVLVDGVLKLVVKLASVMALLARKLQSGRVQSYYVVALIGIILLVAILLSSLNQIPK